MNDSETQQTFIIVGFRALTQPTILSIVSPAIFENWYKLSDLAKLIGISQNKTATAFKKFDSGCYIS